MAKPSDDQIGGGHYKTLTIQPYLYCEANDLSMLESAVVKYVTRYKDKNGEEDLDKAIHCIQLLKEYHYGNGTV